MIAGTILDAFQFKKSNIAIFLGSGSTINDISKKQWKKLKEFDLWTVNNWIYHPEIVPNFYHLELKKYGFEYFKRHMDEKRDKYKDTIFFIQRSKKNLDDLIGSQSRTYTYLQDRDRVHERQNVNADFKMSDGDRLNNLYCSSLTSVLVLMYRFGYSSIILFGVELDNSKYFWTGRDPKYGLVHHQVNKEHEGHKESDPHNTIHIKDFIIDFNERWMIPNKREILVGTKKTLLYPSLRFVEI